MSVAKPELRLRQRQQGVRMRNAACQLNNIRDELTHTRQQEINLWLHFPIWLEIIQAFCAAHPVIIPGGYKENNVVFEPVISFQRFFTNFL